jgi:hypothetical protein
MALFGLLLSDVGGEDSGEESADDVDLARVGSDSGVLGR